MPIFRKKAATATTTITPTFFTPNLVNLILAGGLNAQDQKFLELYLGVPELQAIINYRGRVFAGMRVKAVDKEGNEKDIPQLDLFAQPNPLQNFKEFAMQYHVLRDVFGNDFIHPVFGTDPKMTQALWNMPPMNAEVIPVSDKLIPFNMTKKEEIIKRYDFEYNDSTISYEPGEIIHYNDNQVLYDADEWMLGDSKIRPLVQSCENIKLAYEARGVLIQNSALGILTNESKDGIGTTPLETKDKEQLQKDYRKYGLKLNKWQMIITNAALKWQSMATDVGKLKLFEEVDADFRSIANAYAFPPEILQTDSTYENKEKAITQLYEDAIIPEADEFLQGLRNFLELDFELRADFSHIPQLQVNLAERSKSIQLAALGLSKARESNLIQEKEAQEQFNKFLI